MLKNIWIKYRYWAILGFVVIWMLIFDSNNMIDLYKIRHEINDLEDKRTYYIKEITDLRKEENELFSNTRNLEKFAREKYLMKKDNEDLFIIIE
ncbi:MAG: septum formation initiator family protein [Bacteroidota bacterium]|nr:septum formation initiator family protein [Bacteroidota bacterium]